MCVCVQKKNKNKKKKKFSLTEGERDMKRKKKKLRSVDIIGLLEGPPVTNDPRRVTRDGTFQMLPTAAGGGVGVGGGGVLDGADDMSLPLLNDLDSVTSPMNAHAMISRRTSNESGMSRMSGMSSNANNLIPVGVFQHEQSHPVFNESGKTEIDERERETDRQRGAGILFFFLGGAGGGGGGAMREKN